MLDYVLDSAKALSPEPVTIVVGHGAGRIQDAYKGTPGLRFVVQEPQLGTGHALLQTEPLPRSATGTALLLYGDVPLLLDGPHAEASGEAAPVRGAAATVLTAQVERPYGYGRIVRTGGRIARIVEERDAVLQSAASGSERGITRSTSRPCSTPSRASRRGTRRGGTSCPT